MGENSNIEWTHHSFNPWIGCSKVGPDCKNCYAELDTFPRRSRSKGLELWGPAAHRHVTSDDNWKKPLAWNRAAAKAGERHRVFCASIADVFEDREDLRKPRARLWDLIERTPNLDWLLLTKRPENALRLAEQAWRESLPPGTSITADFRPKAWLPNIWLGTSVGTQATADERIPHLLQVPARVRFLSCEPLLEEIDLKGWGSGAPAEPNDSTPATWDEFVWPDWVPLDQRSLIASFWSAANSRGPRSWLRDHVIQRVPATGARVTVARRNTSSHWGDVNKMSPTGESGRYLHCWNNIGRVVTDDGQVICVAGGQGSGWLSKWLQRDGSYAPKIDWVIVGGESGHKARPCDVRWIRKIVQQCKGAGVATFVKQLGSHPYDSRDFEPPFGDDGPYWITGDDRRYCWHERISDDPLEEVIHEQRHPKGGDPAEWPEDLRVREFPKTEGKADP